jgi:hypothetical protein
MRDVIGHTSGLAVPSYIQDTSAVAGRYRFSLTMSSPRTAARRYRETSRARQSSKEPGGEEGRACRVAVAFNLKEKAPSHLPEDYYAEYDDINVPLAIKVCDREAGA